MSVRSAVATRRSASGGRPAAVQGESELLPGPLAERVLGDERLELAARARRARRSARRASMQVLARVERAARRAGSPRSAPSRGRRTPRTPRPGSTRAPSSSAVGRVGRVGTARRASRTARSNRLGVDALRRRPRAGSPAAGRRSRPRVAAACAAATGGSAAPRAGRPAVVAPELVAEPVGRHDRAPPGGEEHREEQARLRARRSAPTRRRGPASMLPEHPDLESVVHAPQSCKRACKALAEPCRPPSGPRNRAHAWRMLICEMPTAEPVGDPPPRRHSTGETR